MNRPHGNVSAAPAISDSDLREIITGDPVKSARLTVEKAQAYGRYLKNTNLKAAQIRGIFSHVRQLEMNWPLEEVDPQFSRQALRDLTLLKPKLAYQGQRVSAVQPLAELIGRCIDQVGDSRANFQRFVDFFEAILAYHKAEGGSE